VRLPLSDTGSARRGCRRETRGYSALSAAEPPPTPTLELPCLQRFEFWLTPASPFPRCQLAARTLGEPVSYDRIPYFFSDQYRIGLPYPGYATEWDEVAFRGERGSGSFVAFWLSDGRLVAGINVDIWDVHEHVLVLIRSRSPVDRAALTDLDTPLNSLVGEPTVGG
jgi:3-phenylpropionate/trans-cinnamate dioxygenase ferredoxin reductase component